MFKEKTKNIVILLLILNTLFLTAKIWFHEKLWSPDYNLLSSWHPFTAISRWLESDDTYSMPKENLSRPRKFVVNSGSEITVFYNSDPAFHTIFDPVQNALIACLDGTATVSDSAVIDRTEWYDALSGRSVYAEYSLTYTPELFAQIVGVKESALLADYSAIRDFLLIPPETTSDAITLYLRDAEQKQITRYQVTLPEPMDGRVFSPPASEEDLYFFAFDLGLSSDNAEGNTPEQKVLMNPLVLVSANALKTPEIQSYNPLLSEEGSINSEIQSGLLNCFGYNARSTRRYTDTNRTTAFIENFSTLKLYSDGMLEYTALEANKGINVMPYYSEHTSLYESLNSVIDFIETVWKHAVPNQAINVCAVGNLQDCRTEDGGFRFMFDYYVSGNLVTVDLAPPKAIHAPMQHAVEVEIHDGYITSYRHYLRRFHELESTDNLPMIEALNGILTELSAEDESMTISDMFLSYLEDGSGDSQSTSWCVRIDGREGIVRYDSDAEVLSTASEGGEGE